jgi:hypothetical protein
MREIILRQIIEDKFRRGIKSQSACPRFVDIYNSALTALAEVTDTSKIPGITFKSRTSASTYNTSIETIKSWFSIASGAMREMVSDYEKLSNDYNDISTRIFNETNEFKNTINSIMNYSCIYCSPNYSNQTDSSVAGKIGNYITLPFYIRTTEMYNGGAAFNVFSSGTIIFSNTDRITSVPLVEPLSLKVISSNNIGQTTINITVNKTTANMIYFRFMNDIIKCKLILFKDKVKVYEKVSNNGEVLANFYPQEFDYISILVDYNNVNTDKPFPIYLDAFEIFNKIQFSKSGNFESKPYFLNKSSSIDNIGLTYNSSGDSNATTTTNLISISSKADGLVYNKVEDNDTIDVSSYKFRHATNFTGLSDPYSVRVIGDRSFFELSIDELDNDLWNMNFEHAVVFHGINSDFSEDNEAGTGYYGQPYENWTKTGVYWRSMIFVTDDEAWIDIGKSTCLINGTTRTGKFKMPKGISMIDVHEKDIDFNLGKQVINDLSRKDDILSDPLYPFNFAYMFSGLPEYDSNGDKEGKLLRQFNVTGVTTLFLNEPFIPMSLDVLDVNQVEPYRLQLTAGVSTPGTYSIEPYSGKIKIYPAIDGPTNIQVYYRRASFFRRPVGVMFNRLLTFMPIKALIGMQGVTEDQANYKYVFDNESFFTLDGSTQSRKLLLQDVSSTDSFTGNKIQHSQVIYNRTDENFYVSAKIEMETINRYMSPIVRDIYISVG